MIFTIVLTLNSKSKCCQEQLFLVSGDTVIDSILPHKFQTYYRKDYHIYLKKSKETIKLYMAKNLVIFLITRQFGLFFSFPLKIFYFVFFRKIILFDESWYILRIMKSLVDSFYSSFVGPILKFDMIMRMIYFYLNYH